MSRIHRSLQSYNAEPEDKVKHEGDSEPEGFPGFQDQARVTDFQQPTSAIRSTIRDTTSPEEGAKPSRKRRTPVIESGLKDTPGSDFSTSRSNKSSKPSMLGDMVSQRPVSIPTSSEGDPSDSHEESLEPQPKRRKGSGAIPFNSISPRSTSSPSTVNGDRAESVATLSTPVSHIVSTNINVPSATAIATSGIVPATVLRQAFFGAAQTLKYRGPRNPISRHMKISEEQTSSDEEGRRVMWTDGWWSELHGVNGVKLKAGEKGNNLVKDRSRELGGNKKG